ncbi:SusD/RagB family nutrient-binding outer membrane lipoprotein [Zunongwangia sp. F260]|uniref:SusD/RagB family nutrient-binding outer membrane lipoprotein n=1 Tax=Autumnicola lenta TaxID=3075593 RepID=A0ABU3CG93_9FLAO|nr:SusD/RagB family nutrient-binding outer membrane lipoprotein [Zunongwangia sp. F260]MDT0645369.1 SusD/RagB family nutrient-binding outer membrane lipoprotein [Zunongwangia sp. F260]
MKINYIIPSFLAISLGLISCDKDFEEINTNPIEPVSLDPVYQFSDAQQSSAIPTYHYQGEIVQQINVPYGGVLEGGNRNSYNDINSSLAFTDLYNGPIRELEDVIRKTQDDPDRSNLYNMARIMRAYCYQFLVDTYGDVPYTNAAQGFTQQEYFPVYDDQSAIYEDVLNEYEQAVEALDPNGDIVGGDLFYDGDISKWKKFGNSLLLRAGMRYTALNEDKAAAIVQTAVDPSRGGVMSSNDDNAYIQFNATFPNASSSLLLGGERANYYLGEPFVEYLKNTNDPRLEYIAVLYENPSNTLSGVGETNTDPEDQIGMPYGYDENSIESDQDFPGKIGTAFKYSQFNRATVARLDAPEYLVTYAQTQLLLAEANQRGYISTGSAQEHYEAGIKGHMTQTALYGETLNITSEQQEAYLQGPEVAFDPSRALEQINEQYWIASFRIWQEAWANFRRSGYPDLDPIDFPGQDPSVDDFILRLPYPVRELSVNQSNVEAAAANIGGDNLGTPVFWDVPN